MQVQASCRYGPGPRQVLELGACETIVSIRNTKQVVFIQDGKAGQRAFASKSEDERFAGVNQDGSRTVDTYAPTFISRSLRRKVPVIKERKAQYEDSH